jgi:uncharacterized repeat protein (TIGR03803 family)
MRKLESSIALCSKVFVVLLFCLAVVAQPYAQTFRTIANFSGSNGSNVQGALVQGLDGNLYGTSVMGGTGNGNIFKLGPDGTVTSLYNFCSQPNCSDGVGPIAALVLSTDGNFYGTTQVGGAYDHGTIFKFTPRGDLTTLHSFNDADGSQPYAALIQAIDGKFYGSTSGGGVYSCGSQGCGTIFRIDSAGNFVTLDSFAGDDGVGPNGALVQTPDGTFYGTTVYGGVNALGTAFKMSASGALTTIGAFDNQVGTHPEGTLAFAADGRFYGTAFNGGNPPGEGTVYRMGKGGNVAALHKFEFDLGREGTNPHAGIIQGTDGNFYGVTIGGGKHQAGTVFKMTPDGTVTTLHSFTGDDGSYPYAALLQSTDGTFYGTTITGGTSGVGTVFRVSLELPPFTVALPTSGKIGTRIRILGTNFIGTTSVSFNGTPATFDVVSRSLIKATVPVGATIGPITVTTPRGTLLSRDPFYVRQ